MWKRSDKEWKYSKSYFQVLFCFHQKYFIRISLSGPILATQAVFPSPFRWVYYLAHFVFQLKRGRASTNQEKRTYLKLLKRLILTKQRKEYAKTDKDQIADVRTDMALDLKKLKEEMKMIIDGQEREAALRAQVAELESLNTTLTQRLDIKHSVQ